MTVVKIARRTERFTRTENGAWSRHSSVETEHLELDESILKPHYERTGAQHTGPKSRFGFSLGAGITVTWPDGVVEHAYPGNRGVGAYPPECIPANGRLNALLNAKDES